MRQDRVLLRLNEDEKSLFDEVASSQGLATASWARRELLRVARLESGGGIAGTQSPSTGLNLLSLFCGAGGLDEGFKQAGFHTQLATDIDDESVNTFRLNHSESKVDVKDVRELNLEVLDEMLGSKIAPIGVIGGPPCQSFSVSNVHQSEDDARNRLPESYASLLRALNKRNPISFFVFENVPGLLSKRHIERYNHFKRLFERAGFELAEWLLDAKDYGVPQERSRVFIIGINRALFPTAEIVRPVPENSVVTVGETIRGLPEPVHNERGLDPDTFPVHPNHWCLVPRSKKFRSANLQQGQAFGRSFRTLWWDRPSWTVAYGHREVHVHPMGHRRLSIYEAMLLQSFPRYYRLTGNMSAQIRLVSESVPPRLALHIGRAIRQSLEI